MTTMKTIFLVKKSAKKQSDLGNFISLMGNTDMDSQFSIYFFSGVPSSSKEIIASNLLNGTNCYCFSAAQGTGRAQCPELSPPNRGHYFLKKPVLALYCLLNKAQIPYLAHMSLH